VTPRARHPGWALGGLFVLLAVPLAAWAAHQHTLAEARVAELTDNVPQPVRDGYARSGRCEACHPSQYHSWKRGYHRSMTQYPSADTVRGDFSDVHLTGGGYDARMYRQGDDFMVDMVDPAWRYQVDFGQAPPPPPGAPEPHVQRRISMLTGSHHMQAYWIASTDPGDNGQLSVPFTYLFDDHRWVSRSDVFLHPPDERQQIQVWNVSCITCHSTAGQPLANTGRGAQSQVAELGIACEACHGPGERHVAANQDPLRRYWLHVRGDGDPTIVNPARLPAVRASQVCGQCHALTELSNDIYTGAGKTYVAGDDLTVSQPLLTPLHESPELAHHAANDPLYLRNYFWADGTGRVSSRDYTGMAASRCMESGTLWCGTCHSLHDSDPNNLLSEGSETDARCAGCHPQIAANVASHTHHRVDSVGSHCYNCHMPYTIYGLLRAIRNHRIDSPKVTGRTGSDERPNACNLCHVDKSLAWTARALEQWYRHPAPQMLADDTPATVTWLLSGDAILRAIAAWQFGWDGARRAAPVERFVPYLVAALDDPYAAVRYVAGHALKKLDPATEFDYLASPEARRAAAAAILTRWQRTHPEPLDEARIRTLVDQRDDSPVRAME
jgi:predicted CXXCH cytochrome family protein